MDNIIIPMTQRKLSNPISCRFEPRQIKKLEKIARQLGINRTDLIRKATELATAHWIRIGHINRIKSASCAKSGNKVHFSPKR